MHGKCEHETLALAKKQTRTGGWHLELPSVPSFQRLQPVPQLSGSSLWMPKIDLTLPPLIGTQLEVVHLKISLAK